MRATHVLTEKFATVTAKQQSLDNDNANSIPFWSRKSVHEILSSEKLNYVLKCTRPTIHRGLPKLRNILRERNTVSGSWKTSLLEDAKLLRRSCTVQSIYS
ncbi:unnamed protein product [Dovyalis caffra]|uniref:Uncharacterized protein n=1 Tax=Dovyalis caffra TaxID=77055 RepID=A0AAV1S1L3_9ROSI|nr:unnamed protein product [Dovyalis caffra]